MWIAPDDTVSRVFSVLKYHGYQNICCLSYCCRTCYTSDYWLRDLRHLISKLSAAWTLHRVCFYFVLV